MKHRPFELYQDQYKQIFYYTGKHFKTRGWEVFILTSFGESRHYTGSNEIGPKTRLATDRNIIKKLTGFLLLQEITEKKSRSLYKIWAKQYY